ncbi:MAG: peroxiredoxin [Candidatus Anstonellaceae archaeon]
MRKSQVVLSEGMAAPLFKLYDSSNNLFDLSDYKDKLLVVYFYPKDDTPGCTAQACGFSSLLEEFKKLGVEIYGISSDDSLSHKKFIEKYNILFPLLIDKDWKVAKLYGAYKNGKLNRSTFVIKNLIIQKVFYNADPKNNPKEVLDFLKSLVKN